MYTQILSNSTPTRKPNLTLVGLSRSWLCFPMSQQEQQEQEPSHFIRLEGPMCLVGVWKVPNRCLEGIRIGSGVWMSWGCLEGVWRVPGRCLENVFGRCLEVYWMVSDGRLDGIWRESWRCLRAVWMVSVSGQFGADKLILDRSKWDRSS